MKAQKSVISELLPNCYIKKILQNVVSWETKSDCLHCAIALVVPLPLCRLLPWWHGFYDNIINLMVPLLFFISVKMKYQRWYRKADSVLVTSVSNMSKINVAWFTSTRRYNDLCFALLLHQYFHKTLLARKTESSCLNHATALVMHLPICHCLALYHVPCDSTVTLVMPMCLSYGNNFHST